MSEQAKNQSAGATGQSQWANSNRKAGNSGPGNNGHPFQLVFRLAEGISNPEHVYDWLYKNIIEYPCGGLIIQENAGFKIDDLVQTLEREVNLELLGNQPTLVRLETIPLINSSDILPRTLISNIYHSIKISALRNRLPPELKTRLLFTYLISLGRVDYDMPEPPTTECKDSKEFDAGFEVSFGVWSAHMDAKYGKEWVTKEQVFDDEPTPSQVSGETICDSELLAYLAVLIRRFEKAHPLLYSAQTEPHVQTGASIYRWSMDGLSSLESRMGCLLFFPLKLLLRFILWVIHKAEFVARQLPHLVPHNTLIKKKLRLMFVLNVNLARNELQRPEIMTQLLSLFQCTDAVFIVFTDPHTFRKFQKIKETGSI